MNANWGPLAFESNPTSKIKLNPSVTVANASAIDRALWKSSLGISARTRLPKIGSKTVITSSVGIQESSTS
jgi:hypothetical protein